MKKHSRYTDFLKDKEFIRWQLLPDDEQNARWEAFIAENPDQKVELNRAIQYLKTTGLNANALTSAHEQRLLDRINRSISERERTVRKRRYFYFSAAASVVLLIAAGILFFYQNETRSERSEVQQEFIVGSLLNSQDIQLITGSGEAVSFKNDIQVQVDENGNALTVTDSEQAQTTLDMRQNSMNKLVVPFGKRSQLTLADGTHLWLNAGSVLEFPSDFNGNTRDISIEGEIYIDVAHNKNKPFFVHTKAFTVQVLGTKFNVSAYHNFTNTVTLVEGSVMLENANAHQMQLLPDEKATLTTSNTFDKKKVRANSEISWIHGYLTLDETPMMDVLKAIERYYNFSFNYENDASLQKRVCSGKIYLSENIDDVMGTIALLTSTQYVRKDNNIYISNKIN